MVKDMTKREVLERYFPGVQEFRGQQEPAIDALLAGERVLCLMPTGEGKSLIYQVAGLCLGKAVIVISPLIALMKQQSNELAARGLNCLFLSQLDQRQQFRRLSQMGQGEVPDFIFISPERAANDGYLEFVLALMKDKIGLVTIDEAHCISQWGDGFRPAYKTIPNFLNRVFGAGWPRVLCLTATLNPREQLQVRKDFGITSVISSPNLWRDNLKLSILNLGSGKNEKKDAALETILQRHQGEKALVFVHRKYGKEGTTRTLSEKFAVTIDGCDYFDADISDKEKDRVLEGFADGSIKVVFATSAFGMGIDISDIRAVVHYLIPESVEQYYQEVGRAGRDGQEAHGYLLYTDQSRAGRMRLIENSLCNERDLRAQYERMQLKPSDPFGSITYDGLDDSARTAFALLCEYGVVRILAKGVQGLKPFEAEGAEGEAFLASVKTASQTQLTKIVCKKTNSSINDITAKVWTLCAHGQLKLGSSPVKAIFYDMAKELTDEIVQQIMDDQQAKREQRRDAFDGFAEQIRAGESAETIVKTALALN